MIFGNTIAMSQKSLDFLWKQQEVLALNIANVETPGYKKKMVSFEENNVNADVENTKIARSTLHYQYLLQSVSNDIKRFQSVVKVQ